VDGTSRLFAAPHDAVPLATELAARRLNSLIEQQSARLAALLHDDTSQVLASAHMAIEHLACDVPVEARTRLQEVRQHLHSVAEQLRRVSQELHPSIVEDLGVNKAIEFMLREFTRRTGVTLLASVQVDERWSAALGAVVYRFVEEALNNIDEHARATRASVTIACTGSRLLCTVSDDGVGFDVDRTLAGGANRRLGLELVRARLEASGGTLEVTSTPQRGTRLCAVIPLER
jgi:signal transduction histidine kinase